MTNTQKAIEIAEDNFRFYKRLESGELASSKIDCQKSALDMADWKDSFYKPAIDLLIDIINDSQCEDISDDICSVDGNWCENHCGETNPNFNLNCLIKWLKIKGNNKFHEGNE